MTYFAFSNPTKHGQGQFWYFERFPISGLPRTGVLKVLTAEGQFRNPKFGRGPPKDFFFNKTEKNPICNHFNDQVASLTLEHC